MKVFASEKILLQHSTLGYRIDFYFPKDILAIGADKKVHKYRNKYIEIEIQKAVEKYLDCEFIRINPDEKDFYEYVEIRKIQNHIKKPSKIFNRQDFEKINRIRI